MLNWIRDFLIYYTMRHIFCKKDYLNMCYKQLEYNKEKLWSNLKKSYDIIILFIKYLFIYHNNKW